MSYDPAVVGAARSAALLAAIESFQVAAPALSGGAAIAAAVANTNTSDTSVLTDIANDLDARISALEGTSPGLGYQGHDFQQASAATTSSATLVDATGFPSWSFSAPVAKTYLVHVDCSLFVATETNGPVWLQLVVNGTAVGTARKYVFHDNTWMLPISFRVPAAFLAGANTIKLQWRTDGVATASTTTDCSRAFTVTG